jgi:hypothetical protein
VNTIISTLWNPRRAARGSALVLLLLFMAERPAAAYMDPGSGALLWQILVGGFLGAAFYFRRITRLFHGKRNKDRTD